VDESPDKRCSARANPIGAHLTTVQKVGSSSLSGARESNVKRDNHLGRLALFFRSYDFRRIPTTKPPRNPATIPSGPVIRIPNSGPWFASGRKTSGPIKPKRNPIEPTIRAPMQPERIAEPISPRRAYHQQTKASIPSGSAIRPNKVYSPV